MGRFLRRCKSFSSICYFRDTEADLVSRLLSLSLSLSFQHLTPIPAGFPLEAAAPILCAGVTVYKALKEAALLKGEVVV